MQEQPAQAHAVNGNRSSHAAARHGRPNLSTPYLEPRNELERALAELWEKTLGISNIGVNDRFVALGGHSLLAIQLVSRIRNLFEIELPVAAFHRAPTIAGVAQLLLDFLINNLDPDTLEQMIDNFEPSAV